MQNPQFVAVDTNVLMRLADGNERTIDAWQLICRRVPRAQFLVPPTVLGELADKLHSATEAGVRKTARQALLELRPRWQMTPMTLTSVEETMTENAARQLRHSGLLPDAEHNDARIIAESALRGCILLVSHDSHLLAVDHRRLTLLFRQLDLDTPVIASPDDILNRFYT